MPKASCQYEGRSGEYILCKLTGEHCGNVKFCRAENRWKLSDNAVNCTLPKKYKEGKYGTAKKI